MAISFLGFLGETPKLSETGSFFLPEMALVVKTVLGSHFGSPPILEPFFFFLPRGDWDVHWGYGAFDPWPYGC